MEYFDVMNGIAILTGVALFGLSILFYRQHGTLAQYKNREAIWL